MGGANLIGVCSTGGKMKKAFAGLRVLDFNYRLGRSGWYVAQLGFALQLEGTEEFVLHRCHRVAMRIGTFNR